MSWFDILRRDADSTGKKRPGDESSFGSASSSLASSTSSVPLPVDSWAMLILNRLRDDADLHDLVDCLTSKDMDLSAVNVDREFIEDHVLFVSGSGEQYQTISMSGLRGAIQADNFFALGLLPDGQARAMKTNQKPTFDSFDLDASSITPDHPSCKILASNLKVQLEDSTIEAITVQRPISRKEVQDWMNQRQNAETNSLIELEKSFRKKQPSTADDAKRKCTQFLDREREKMEKAHVRRMEMEDRLDILETSMCERLYDCLFKKASDVESARDEVLQSRIAKLNLLDLNLEHLGVSLGNQDEKNNVFQAVKRAGEELQLLDKVHGAKEKLDVLVKTHHVIDETIDFFDKATKGPAKASTGSTSQEIKDVDQNNELSSCVNDKKDTAPSSASGETLTPTKGSKQELLEADDSPRSRHVNGDTLLPLLIFTIVKANPTHFNTNLAFILLYRQSARITGLQSYCITNMLAAVEFLVTIDLRELNLPPGVVLSHSVDLVESEARPVGEDARLERGFKLMSGVVMDGISRLMQKKDSDASHTATGWPGTSAQITDMMNQMMHRLGKAAPPSRELDDMTPKESANKTNTKADPLQSLWQVPSRLIQSVQRPSQLEDGPLRKFLDIKSIEELTIGEVAELLADYKRLAAIVQQFELVKHTKPNDSA